MQIKGGLRESEASRCILIEARRNQRRVPGPLIAQKELADARSRQHSCRVRITHTCSDSQ
jgi:hypothetical protein